MNGYLILYDEFTYRGAVEFNHNMFGRVVKSGRNFYFYPGKLSDVKHYRLSHRCLFVANKPEGLASTAITYSVDINLQQTQLYTGREYFRNLYKDYVVRNIDKCV